MLIMKALAQGLVKGKINEVLLSFFNEIQIQTQYQNVEWI